MFEKEVTRYYCLKCKKVSKNLRMDKCPYCRGDCEKVKLESSRWGRIGKPAAIIFGVTFWIWSFVLILIGRGNLLPGGAFMLIPSFFGAIFFLMIFSVKDENIIAAKISKMKGVPPPLDIITFPPRRLVKKDEKTCGTCLRPVPASTKKCPFCGYDYL